MPINIGGAFTIRGTGGGQAFEIDGASPAMDIDTTGRMFLPNQPGFCAGYTGTDPGWVAQPADTWVYQNYLNNTTYSKGFAASRFTAPIAGWYLFHVYSYHNKASSAATTGWVYAQVYVNGAAPGPHQVIGYTQPATYSFSAEQAIILQLLAGDYADMYIYCSGGGTSCYRAYSGFEGYLVG